VTTTSSARKTVVASVLVTGALVGIRDVSRGHSPSLKTGVGLAFSSVLLGLMADGAPALASGFALLLAVGAVVSTGAEVFDSIKKGVT
jgi:hypothetical protein